MIPTVARGGHSFKGAFQYYLHDQEAETRERVAWTHTENMLTDNPDKAWKVMAYTAKSQERLKEASGQRAGGAKLQKPVMAYSLSWHPEQDPSKDHMLEVALRSLKVLGLEEHEAVVIAHRDTPHRHVHVVANRVHPTTGLVASDSHSYRKLSTFAREYHEEHGLTYCPQRMDNHQKQQQGERARYRDPKIAEAWAQSDNGQSFAAALQAQGYQIAQGRRGLVLIDPYGKQINPVRHLEGIKTKEFKERCQDLATNLPDATELAQQVAQQHQQRKVAATQSKDARQEFNGQAKEQAASRQPVAKGDFKKAAQKSEQPQQPPRAQKSEDKSKQAAKPSTPDKSQELAQSRRQQLVTQYKQRIVEQKRSMGAEYRLDERRTAIREMEGKCANPSIFRRIFGLARRDRQELATMKQDFAETQKRYQQRLDALKDERDQALAKLEQEREDRQQRASQATKREQQKQSTQRKQVAQQKQRPRPEPTHRRATTAPANDNPAPQQSLTQEFNAQQKPEQVRLDQLAAKQRQLQQRLQSRGNRRSRGM